MPEDPVHDDVPVRRIAVDKQTAERVHLFHRDILGEGTCLIAEMGDWVVFK